MTFADQLKAERKRLGMSQGEIAELLSLPFRTYWEYEAGKTEPALIAQEGALARLERQKPKQSGRRKTIRKKDENSSCALT